LNLVRDRAKLAAMKIVTIIARVLLGLIFVVFGLNGFLHFIPMPPPDESTVSKFSQILMSTGFMTLVFLCQIVGGLLVLLGFFVPLGLTILTPVIVNIFLVHALMAPSGLPMAILVAALDLFLIWRYWGNFAGLVRQGT
jgi:putative oxidoreductase